MAGTVHTLEPVAWLHLRIALRWVAPEVWRVVVVPETITLNHLHHVIQAAMGWSGGHLHEFIIGGRHYGTPDPDGWDRSAVTSEKGVALLKVLGRGKRLTYLYDFGDGWEHTVAVGRRVPPPPTQKRAPVLCLAGENACPPEDVGGPPGYEEFLLAIADPTHEEHEHMLEWCGGEFDPTRCDLEMINQRLAELRIPTMSRR